MYYVIICCSWTGCPWTRATGPRKVMDMERGGEEIAGGETARVHLEGREMGPSEA